MKGKTSSLEGLCLFDRQSHPAIEGLEDSALVGFLGVGFLFLLIIVVGEFDKLCFKMIQ